MSEYKLKNIELKYSEKEPFFKPDTSSSNDLFKTLSDIEFWSKNENRIIISWNSENDKQKLIINLCKSLEEDTLYEMRKSCLKYILYKQEKNDNVWNILKEEFLNNYYFIQTVNELLNLKIVSDKQKEKYYNLVFETFTDNSFDISNIRKKYEVPIGCNLDSKGFLQKFIYILIGKYDEHRIFQQRILVDQNNHEKLFKTTAEQFLKLQDFQKELAKDIYLLSLEKEVLFIEYFKKNVKYNSAYSKIETLYKEYEYLKENKQQLDFIINDLFAMSIFSNKDIRKFRFYRYPLWLIIKLYYTKTNERNNCIPYLELLNTNAISSTKNNSLLHSKISILSDHVCEQLSNYFILNKKSEKTTIKFSLKQLHIDIENCSPKLKDLIRILIENIIENEMKNIIMNVTENNDLLNKINGMIDNEFGKIIKSFNNKSIFKYAKDEKIIQIINDDFLKYKTITVEPVEETLFEIINKKIKSNKQLPSFLDRIDTDKTLLFDIIKIINPFLNENTYMHEVINDIINIDNQTKGIKLIKELINYVTSNITQLHLLNNVYKAASILVDIQSITHKLINNNIKEISFSFITRLDSLIQNIPIPIKNLQTKYNNFKTLIKNSNELYRRCNWVNVNFLNLKLYFIVIESLNEEEKNLLLEGNKCNSLTFINNFMDLSFSEFIESFKNIENLLECNKNKFLVDILKICYYKNKNEPNILKEIISFLSMKHIELSFEGISLYQQIIEDLISLPLKKKDNYYSINCQDIFSCINDKATFILGSMLNYIMKQLESPNKIKQLSTNSSFVLIQSIEKLFLKILFPENIEIFDDENIFQTMITCINYISTLNNNIVQNKMELSNPLELFKQYIAISFLKLYFYTYIEVIISERNTTYCYNSSEYLCNNQHNEIINLLEFYILKIIRTKYCSTFNEFSSFNYIGKQILWASNLYFKGTYKTEFEYIFFSYCKYDQNSPRFYFDKYNTFITCIFNPLLNVNFRTSDYIDEVTNFLKEYFDMYIDVIMNIILCNTYQTKYLTHIQFIEFSSWSKYLIEYCSDLNKNLIDYFIFVSIYEFNKSTPNTYCKIIDSISMALNERENISLIHLEIIFISLKFVLALILNNTSLPLSINIPDMKENSYNLKLIYKLIQFIKLSTQYYKETTKKNCQEIFKTFHEIEDLLRINNINLIKLFMNFLYYKIKTSQNIATFDDIFSIINNSINEWPNQTPFIKLYYEETKYKDEKIRNLLTEERYTPEALNSKECNIQGRDKDHIVIPVYKFFFYEEYPSWNHFCKTYENNLRKDKYPYLYYLINKKKTENYSIYGRKLSSNEINDMLNKDDKNEEKKDYFEFEYSGFKSLDELVIYYSKSYVFVSKEINRNLGYLIEYDVDEIEREIAGIEYCVVEKVNK